MLVRMSMVDYSEKHVLRVFVTSGLLTLNQVKKKKRFKKSKHHLNVVFHQILINIKDIFYISYTVHLIFLKILARTSCINQIRGYIIIGLKFTNLYFDKQIAFITIAMSNIFLFLHQLNLECLQLALSLILESSC